MNVPSIERWSSSRARVRPQTWADNFVLDLLGKTTFRAGDFARMADGSVRLHSQLTRAVVASCRVPQDRVDEDARWLRSLLLGKSAQCQAQDVAAVTCGVAL
jgi:hypothetical protein